MSAKYQVYVSHLIGEIQTLTEANEWRFMPGKLNPVDAAIRSQLETKVVPYGWLEGLSFLFSIHPSTWPKDLPWMAEKDEMRSVNLNMADTQTSLDFNWFICPNNGSRASSID